MSVSDMGFFLLIFISQLSNSVSISVPKFCTINEVIVLSFTKSLDDSFGC